MCSQKSGNLLKAGKERLLHMVGIKGDGLNHQLRINGTVYGHLTFISGAESGPHNAALHLEPLCLLKCCKCLYK